MGRGRSCTLNISRVNILGPTNFENFELLQPDDTSPVTYWPSHCWRLESLISLCLIWGNYCTSSCREPIDWNDNQRSPISTHLEIHVDTDIWCIVHTHDPIHSERLHSHQEERELVMTILILGNNGLWPSSLIPRKYIWKKRQWVMNDRKV